MNRKCAHLTEWLQHALTSADATPPPASLVEHIATCNKCKARLVMLVTDPLLAHIRPADPGCDVIADRIPDFVDHERAFGLAAALKDYPQVWWHMLGCPDCEELYRTVQELALSEVIVAPVPSRRRHMPRLVRFSVQIHPAMLQQMISLQHRLGVHWGPGPIDLLLNEQQDDGLLIQLYLKHDQTAHMVLVLQTHPPVDGVAAVTLGGVTHRQPLNEGGLAIFDQLGDLLLSSRDELDLAVAIEPASAASAEGSYSSND